jgi:hypothetical protein
VDLNLGPRVNSQVFGWKTPRNRLDDHCVCDLKHHAHTQKVKKIPHALWEWNECSKWVACEKANMVRVDRAPSAFPPELARHLLLAQLGTDFVPDFW